MTTFLDGPAKNAHLMVRRAAVFLRAVRAGDKWDALDQLDDTARDDEEVFAYKIEGEVGMCFVRRTGGGCGAYPVARYRFIPEQPSDEILRDNAKWRAWTREQVR